MFCLIVVLPWNLENSGWFSVPLHFGKLISRESGLRASSLTKLNTFHVKTKKISKLIKQWGIENDLKNYASFLG